MCHSRTLNNKINRIQERALRIIYSDYNLAKILPMNLEAVIIFKEQISKLYNLAVNLLKQ